MVDDNITNLIIETLKLEGRDRYVVQHLLNGGKQRDCTWEGKELNPNTVSTIRSKHIPFVQFERNGVSIVDINAPDWLKSSGLYIPQVTHTEPVKQPVKRIARKNIEPTITVREHEEKISEVRAQLLQGTENAILENTTKISRRVRAEVEAELAISYKEEAEKSKESLRVKYIKETSDLFQRQLENANAAAESAKNNLESAKKEIADLQQLLSDETVNKGKLETLNTDLVSKNKQSETTIAELRAQIVKLSPKIDRAFVLQSLVSCGWLLGLAALSVFSIENMLIYFNAGSFWIVAVILGVFIEFMLWATNITRFAGSLNDADSEDTSRELSLVIFFFRAFANSLGGYYIATNAKEFAKESGLYANISTKFTDINELYFGFEVGGAGMVVTAIIIGAFVAYMEYKALPLAIRHAYNLFIKKVD